MTIGCGNLTGRGRAPGKIILLGEHAVVYGRPALAATIDRHVEVQATAPGRAVAPPASSDRAVGRVPDEVLRRALELLGLHAMPVAVTTSADLPIGVGLGSSAACSVALLRALAELTATVLDDATVCVYAFELERLFHGYPSGIDNTVCAHGGLVRFQRSRPIQRVAAPQPFAMVVAVGRMPRQTRGPVMALRRKWEADPSRYEKLFDEVAALVDAGEAALARGDGLALGATMQRNHALLRQFGVSTDELERMVELAGAHGALGAKLTGGGGGGAVICLVAGDPLPLVTAFVGAGWKAFATRISGSQRGVHGLAHNDWERRAARI